MTRSPPRINNKQGRKVNQLIKSTCCNYQQGNCLLLDDDEATPCPLLLSRSLSCKWFRDVVLPADKNLYAEIFRDESFKKCCVCGQPFHAESNRAKYCERCRKSQRRKQEAERQRNRRKTK
ncbi:MAG: conjugal transfer protein [Subdoligranulum sp.]|nr:conjugal transfer protein [Subdoligranulum sp.]